MDHLSASAASPQPGAQYLVKYTHEFYYLWDELAAAAWLDPKIITKEDRLYVDVDCTRGATYGDTLTWSEAAKPDLDLRLVHVQTELDLARFNRLFVEMMKAPPQR